MAASISAFVASEHCVQTAYVGALRFGLAER